MLAVPMQPGSTLVAGRPQVLFEAEWRCFGVRPYDVAPDGRFFIIRSGQTEAGGGTASNIIVVLNWLEELKKARTLRVERSGIGRFTIRGSRRRVFATSTCRLTWRTACRVSGTGA